MSRRPTICVYCGSRDGTSAAFPKAAEAFGTALGERGCDMVYGGGRVGLMGRVADAALAAGARVTGVIPETLMRREVGHTALTELHVVPDMHQRKQMMAERADAFVALPGGLGTFEELFEVWTWRHLGYHAKPLGLLDVAGYYRPFMSLLDSTVSAGFVDAKQMGMLSVAEDAHRLLDAVLHLLAISAPASSGPDDLSRI